MGHPCESSHILFFIQGPAIYCFVLELRKYHKISQIQNSRYTAIVKSFAPKS